MSEGAGPVANDSLAAESTRSGGGFSQNRDGEPLGVKGGNSTFNTTNTSGATKLPPTSDAAHRGNPNEQPRYAEGLGGQPDFSGAHLPSGGYVGGGGDLSKQGYQTQGAGSAGAAPSYVAPVTQNPGSTKPKGANLKEDLNIDDSKNASWNTDIGSKDDPGRLAENQFQLNSTENTGNAARGARSTEHEGVSQPYAPLRAEEPA